MNVVVIEEINILKFYISYIYSYLNSCLVLYFM